ncbi:hypothetical protein ACFLZ1_05325 [Patescibacteria group bacterium]
MKTFKKVSLLLAVLLFLSASTSYVLSANVGKDHNAVQTRGEDNEGEDPADGGLQAQPENRGPGDQDPNDDALEDDVLNSSNVNTSSGGGKKSKAQNAYQKMEMVMQQTQEMVVVMGEGVQQQTQQQTQEKLQAALQKQAKTQDQIAKQLGKLESKQGLMKKLFGPDYKAMKALGEQVGENKLMIKTMEELYTEMKTQTQNKGEADQLQVMIQAMLEQNTALQEQLKAEEKVGSIFGWLAKLFV